MKKSKILNKWLTNENNDHPSCPMLKYFDACAENTVVVEYGDGIKQVIHIWNYMNAWETCTKHHVVRYMILSE